MQKQLIKKLIKIKYINLIVLLLALDRYSLTKTNTAPRRQLL